MLRFAELKSLTLKCGVTVHQGDMLIGCSGYSHYVALIHLVRDDDTRDSCTIVYVRNLTRNIIRAISDDLLNEEFVANDFALA